MKKDMSYLPPYLSPREMNKLCVQSTPKKFGTHLNGKKTRKRGGVKRK